MIAGSETIQQPLRAIRISQLSNEDRDLWRRWIRAVGDLASSPFLTPEYAESVCAAAPGAEIVRLTRGAATVGFWAFQRRGETIQPLAAPITDYQQIICSAEVDRDVSKLIKAVGASRYRFTGLAVGSGPAPAGAVARRAMIADIRSGYATYFARQKRIHPKYFKDKLRQIRHLEGADGALTFTWHDPDPAAFAWLLDRKRAQFRTTAQYDVFACGWTEQVLHRLIDVRTSEFGGSVFTMRDEGRLIAAIYTLRSGPVCHIWFPTYDRSLSRFSPGAVSMLNLIRLAANQGISFVDFGLEGEKYKQYFAEPSNSFFEGAIRAGGAHLASSQPSNTASSRSASQLQRLVLKARRRRFVLSACEPHRLNRLIGLLAMAGGLIVRRLLRRNISEAMG